MHEGPASLSMFEPFRFKRDLDKLNHLLSRSSTSIVGHHQRFRVDKRTKQHAREVLVMGNVLSSASVTEI